MHDLTDALLANHGFRSVRKLEVVNLKASRHAKERKREHPSGYERSWTELASLLEKLPLLQDLIYDGRHDFPPTLLETLRTRNLSACRLHIKNFSMPSLIRPIHIELKGPLRLEPAELALFTSPNLFAVTLARIIDGEDRKTVDYNYEALLQYVGCTSVRRVKVHLEKLWGPWHERRQPFPGLSLPKDMAWSKGRLSRIALQGIGCAIEQWEQCTDLSVLRTLEVADPKNGSLEWVSRYGKFASLSAIRFFSIHNYKPLGTYTYKATDLVQSLQSLTELAFSAPFNGTTLGMVQQLHGATLKRLCIGFRECSLDQIRGIRKGCPVLEHLDVEGRRSGGDEQEVLYYEELGLIPRLRTLRLWLDCAVYVSDAYMDRSSTPRTVRQTFVNCAVDRSLAGAIFQRIANARRKGPTLIQSVELEVIRAGRIHLRGDRTIGRPENSSYHHFERVWTCSFDPRDDRNRVIVHQTQRCPFARQKKHRPELEVLEKVFRSIWPGKPGSDWMKDWKSFPLAPLPRDEICRKPKRGRRTA